MRTKTVIMHYNIKSGVLTQSYFTEEWAAAVWADRFMDSSIWFVMEVER